MFLIQRKSDQKIVDINKNIENIINKSKTLKQEYKSDLIFLDNTIIFYEFLKDFVSIMTQTHQYENIVDELFSLY